MPPMSAPQSLQSDVAGQRIRIRGLVQGVGFRPTVWRLAQDCGLRGEVCNDAEGVLIQVWGTDAAIEGFVQRLRSEAPPLSRIDAIECRAVRTGCPVEQFRIVASRYGEVHTGIVADAATCPECLHELFDPANRRYRYPFINCTHCGPRLSIVHRIPYDRAHTSMADFPLCPACRREYTDPADRRFHAQPNACAVCGPRFWLADAEGGRLEPDMDPIGLAARHIRGGAIVAVKGIGGIHLACDATNQHAVECLRSRKRRYHKAFALMARDLDMVRQFARVGEAEVQLLSAASAPVVILDSLHNTRLASSVAPAQSTLGFMLPYSPAHHLLMADLDRPIVLTSGNRSDEPQCIGNEEALTRLCGIADYWLLHDRDIVNRLDDSVVRVIDGTPRFYRRARGFAPQPLNLPPGFDKAPAITALGGELKNTFCLLKDGQAILSQHIGDLEDAATHTDYRHHLDLYQHMFQHEPERLATDMHPDYLSTQWGRQWAARAGLHCEAVQHHHAHIAGCMAEQGFALDTAPVLGIALDGLGYGDDGSLWGGEFLLADYRNCRRLGHLQPIAMPGGAQAMREPWRNTYAYLVTVLGWQRVERDFGDLELTGYLRGKPIDVLGQMIARGLNCPRASSAGRLFDAVAAAVGVCRDAAGHEGQTGIELEALAQSALESAGAVAAYPFQHCEQDDRLILQSTPMWLNLLSDLRDGVSTGVIAARFHIGLAQALSRAARLLSTRYALGRVVLSGGVFQNRLLLELLAGSLRDVGLEVFAPTHAPANDGGLSLGQAVVAAARSLPTDQPVCRDALEDTLQ